MFLSISQNFNHTYLNTWYQSILQMISIHRYSHSIYPVAKMFLIFSRISFMHSHRNLCKYFPEFQWYIISIPSQNVSLQYLPFMFLAVQNSSIGFIVRPLVGWLVALTKLTIRVFTRLQSEPRDLWHLIRVMRRHDLTKKSTYPPNYLPTYLPVHLP